MKHENYVTLIVANEKQCPSLPLSLFNDSAAGVEIPGRFPAVLSVNIRVSMGLKPRINISIFTRLTYRGGKTQSELPDQIQTRGK